MTRTLLTRTVTGALLGLAVLLAPLSAQAASEVLGEGTFVGKSKHKTSGNVTILKTDNGVLVILDRNFSLDGAPDPKLGFGKDGYDTDTTFSKLDSLRGLQVYRVPASIDPSNYNEFYIWCEKFSVPLGLAELK